MSNPITSTTDIIAGRNAGKRVRVVPAVAPAYDLIKKAADSGQHWARIAVHSLRALTSGRLGKDNIFVRPDCTIVRGREEFFVMLPGCKATLERRTNDDYVLVNLEIDAGYYEMNSQRSMTGLYEASKDRRGKWDAEYVENGELKPTPGQSDTRVWRRVVGISDGDYRNAVDAANDMAEGVSKAPWATRGSGFTEYDLHYTAAGKKKLGGLVNFKTASNPLFNSSINGSAIMLARTMYKAKDIKGIQWVSEFGGSAVLTQAMQILASKGITLDNHSAYLYRPSSNVDQALQYAHQLGLKLDREFVKTLPQDYMGNRHQGRMIYRRVRVGKKEPHYTLGNAGWDMLAQAKNVQGLAAGVMGALGVTGVITLAPASIPVISAVATAIGVTAGALTMGDKVVELVAPRWYNKHIGKIK